MRLPQRKTLFFSLLISTIIIVILGTVNFFWYYQGGTSDCKVITETRIVRGNSMVGLIDEGSEVKILFGYYDCHPIQKGEIIAFHYNNDKNPIIKTVRGVAGDTFRIVKSDPNFEIQVNNSVVKNSLDQTYWLDNKEAEMLKLYESDYNGIIPNNSYLILGNAASGSIDSRRFGLVDKEDILGKVVY